MACQRPIVSFDLLETRRSAGDAAFYVEEDDPRLFASALLKLLDDQPRREKMGKIGLERSVNLVGLERSQRALLDAYSRMRGNSTAFVELPDLEPQEKTVEDVAVSAE
jgi:glycosyltransferase involved in cell wall biosynthesis